MVVAIAAAGGLAVQPLVIAGAGSEKTNTVAHRVAHLIVQGADPRRILLMTFSRRFTRSAFRVAFWSASRKLWALSKNY